MNDTPRILLQLSDMHVVPEAKKHSSWAEVGDCLCQVAGWVHDLSIKPDAMIITGDLVDDGQIESYAYLKELLREFDLPIYVIPGNHDHRERLKDACADFIGNKGAENFEFIQYAVNIGCMRLVALDSLEEMQSYGVLCEKRLQWLTNTLAEEPNMPTIIAMHHPPFKTGMRFMDDMRLLHGAEQLESIISANKQVKRLICGHQHRASVQYFGQTLAFIAPSSSHQLTLQFKKDDPLGYTHERPSVALHMWNDADCLITSHLLGIDGAWNKFLF